MTIGLLGGFEHRVLLTTLRLQPDAFTAAIVSDLETRTGRTVAVAAVYIALKRLHRKGFVRSETRTEPSGGETRPRRYFEPTREGVRVLREEREELKSLWRGLGKELGVR